jgi:hypothetical protein
MHFNIRCNFSIFGWVWKYLLFTFCYLQFISTLKLSYKYSGHIIFLDLLVLTILRKITNHKASLWVNFPIVRLCAMFSSKYFHWPFAGTGNTRMTLVLACKISGFYVSLQCLQFLLRIRNVSAPRSIILQTLPFSEQPYANYKLSYQLPVYPSQSIT